MTTAQQTQEQPQGVTGHRKTEARLMAVQALYQYLLLEQNAEVVIAEFTQHRMRGLSVDKALFTQLFNEGVENQTRYEGVVAAQLKGSWTLDRIGLVERSILIAALAELDACPKTPTKVIMNEFINIAGAFLADDEMRFVNAILDKAAKVFRD